MVDFSSLSSHFQTDQIEWRVGSTTQDKTKGLPLAYIDARTVMDRLDNVCGPENWQCRYTHAETKTVCEIGIRVNNEWIWKANGAGDTDFEAEKGALSDAFKRAAVVWGIGRYLYDVKAPWVEIEQRGKSYYIKNEELTKLYKLLRAPGVKEHSLIDRYDGFWNAIATAKTKEALEKTITKGAALTNEVATKDKERHEKLLAFIGKRREELSADKPDQPV